MSVAPASPRSTANESDTMSDNKPTPSLDKRSGQICPVCGKRSYSREGVHPQCSMAKADEPRRLRLAAEKKKAQSGS